MFIVLIFFICCFQVQTTLSDQTLVIPSTIKQQISETVVPSYCTAYTILNEHIVRKLLQLDVNSTEETVKALVDSLLCAAKNVQQELKIASESIEQIRNATDLQIAQLIISVGQQEENVRQSQNAVNQANIDLQHVQQQVSLAQTAVHDAHHALGVADQAVHDAHRAVERARHCGIGRRRKRFLGDLKKIARKVILRPICSVANSGGIDRAKGRRRIAEENLHHEQNRLRTHQQNLAQKQAEHTAAQTRLHTANTQLQTTTSTLEEQRSQRLLWIDLLKKFKDIENHLADALSPSNVLVDEIANLIDFETVIAPLHEIYNVMLKNQLIIPFGFEISAETTIQIKDNLDKLSKSLPNMPLYSASEANSKGVLTTLDDKCSFPAIKQQCSFRSVAKRSEFAISTETTTTTIDSMLGKIISVYRYQALDAHFYTTDSNEIGTNMPGSIGKFGYKYEGVGFHLLSVELPETVPFYRYGAGVYKHFYTANWQEIGTNIKGAISNGLTCEGIIGYVYQTQQPRSCPLYRYLHVSTSQHFYTIHPCEIGTITPGTIGRHSYRFEGIAAYVPTSFSCPQDIKAC